MPARAGWPTITRTDSMPPRYCAGTNYLLDAHWADWRTFDYRNGADHPDLCRHHAAETRKAERDMAAGHTAPYTH